MFKTLLKKYLKDTFIAAIAATIIALLTIGSFAIIILIAFLAWQIPFIGWILSISWTIACAIILVTFIQYGDELLSAWKSDTKMRNKND